jgi:hypothetical protein
MKRGSIERSGSGACIALFIIPCAGRYSTGSAMRPRADAAAHAAAWVQLSRVRQHTPGVEGYVFDGADGSQMAFWTIHWFLGIRRLRIR